MGRGAGTKRITIDSRTWMKGAAENNESLEGGFSPDSKGVGAFATPGLIKGGHSVSATATNAFAADESVFGFTTKDVNSGTNLTQLATGDTVGDGRFYTVHFITGAVTLAATDTARDYAVGISDMVKYAGSIITTSATNAGLSDNVFGTNDFDWWTTVALGPALTAGTYHVMTVLDSVLYIADGRYVHSWDGTTVGTNALDFGANNYVTAMTTHDGMIWITVAPTPRSDQNLFTRGTRLISWDGIQDSWDVEIPLEQPVYGLFSHNGSMYVGSYRTFQIFTGSGVASLRRVGVVSKEKIAFDGDDLFFLESRSAGNYAMIRYGSPIAGRAKAFYPVFEGSSSSGTPALGNAALGRIIFVDGRDLKLINQFGANQANSTIIDIKRPLGGFAFIRHIELETEVLESGDSFAISYINSAGTEITVGTHSTVGQCFYGIDVESQAATYVIQLKIVINGTKGIRRAHIYYEDTERQLNG